MSRTVKVKEIQNAIADVRAWANDQGDAALGPPPLPDLLKATAELLELLLSDRELLTQSHHDED